MEIWKDIKDYEGLYQISSLRKSKKTFKNGNEKILNQYYNKKGYLIVHLSKDSKRNCQKVHRLVAKAFILNPENKSQVNHKNGIKSDNSLENLEWVTCKENINHAWAQGLYDNMNKNSKRDKKGRFVKNI